MVKLSVLGNKMVIQKVIMGFSLFSMFTTLLHKYSGDEQIILFLTVVIFLFL